MKVKNVVVVCDFNYIEGGASKIAIKTAELLQEHGLNVFLFSGVTDDVNKKTSYHNICLNIEENLKDSNKIRGTIRGLYNLKSKKELRKLLSTLDPKDTIIHIHSWTKSLSSSIFSLIFKKKFQVVLTLHDYFTYCPNGGFFNYPQNKICHLKPLKIKCIKCNCDSRNYFFKLYRILRTFIQNKIVKLPQKIQNIIYISDLQWKVLKDNFSDNVNAVKILNPIEIEKIKKVNKKDYFLYVGRISKEKGVQYFCEACQKLNIKGVIVGDGPIKNSFQEKYPFMKYTGWLSKEEVNNYLIQAKALVFPSLWYEGAPLTVEEALNLNIPCIVSDASSAVEKIVPGKNGYIYQKDNIDDLVNKMSLIDSLKYIKSHESYDDKKYIEKLLNYYKSLK